MNTSKPHGMEWLAPWKAVADGAALDAELRAEIVKGHPLHGLQAMAVARRIDCDDVLFCVDHPSYSVAVVRLTWQKPETDPRWPHAQLFADWDDWISNCMKPDNADYQGEGG